MRCVRTKPSNEWAVRGGPQFHRDKRFEENLPLVRRQCRDVLADADHDIVAADFGSARSPRDDGRVFRTRARATEFARHEKRDGCAAFRERECERGLIRGFSRGQSRCEQHRAMMRPGAIVAGARVGQDDRKIAIEARRIAHANGRRNRSPRDVVVVRIGVAAQLDLDLRGICAAHGHKEDCGRQGAAIDQLSHPSRSVIVDTGIVDSGPRVSSRRAFGTPGERRYKIASSMDFNL